MKLYAVLMRRYGDDEDHTYFEGVYSTLEKAQKMGDAEKEYRGNKYEPFIKELELDVSSSIRRENR